MKKLRERGLLRGKEDNREEIDEERGKKLGMMRRKKIMSQYMERRKKMSRNKHKKKNIKLEEYMDQEARRGEDGE